MIISILGTSGAKLDKKKCVPLIDETYDLPLYDAVELGKDSSKYKNATHFLLENYEGPFYLLGTECAIKYQKKLLGEELKGKDVNFFSIKDNDLEDIFEKVFTLLNKYDNIILDITHGFRHQPIMAIFASTLSQFLERKNLKIIFAKEEEEHKRYKYTYLDQYIETTHVTLLLGGFIRTLNFIPVESSGLINSSPFENFSRSLLANDLKGVVTHSENLLKELDALLNEKRLNYINDMLRKIKDEELKELHGFRDKPDYEKYLILSRLTKDRNYIIVSLTYLFESLREYAAIKFEPLLEEKDIKLREGYHTHTAVMDTIIDNKREGKLNVIQNKYPALFEQNEMEFQRVGDVYKKMRKLRNNLVHINKNKEFADIKHKLSNMIYEVEALFEDNLLDKIITI